MGTAERVDAITELTPDYAVTAPPVPKSVKIELTARCDFACYFCATASGLRVKRDMEFSLLERLLGEMRDAGVEEIGLFYLGESFLYPRLADAVKLAKDIGYPYIFLTTNGRTATADRVRQCIENGLDSLKFSFNWADPEQCREVTRVDAFDRVVNNIRSAWAIRNEVKERTGHHCQLAASSIRYDGEQQERMEAAIAVIRPWVDEHYWLPLYSQAGLREGQVAGNTGRYDNQRDPLPCWSLFTEGHITYDGKLSACCFDHDGRFDMGDLTRMSFFDAWHSQPFQELRDANLKKDVTGTACEKCIAYS